MNHIRKPDWLKVKLGSGLHFKQTQDIVGQYTLNTICKSGKCPNIGECWANGTATFMIAGEICTRSCKFCNTKTGKPSSLDPQEPANIAQSVQAMKLQYVVITSVDRDDLPDLGLKHWLKTIHCIKELVPEIKIEVLIPDFQGRLDFIDEICTHKPNVIGHNIETVRRLTPLVRSAAQYKTSLDVIKRIAENKMKAKSGLMLGLGESQNEIIDVMDDLLHAGCSSLTIGQYLQPTRKHLPVEAYIHPDVFAELKEIALNKGFLSVESGPLVRSSYHAAKTQLP